MHSVCGLTKGELFNYYYLTETDLTVTVQISEQGSHFSVNELIIVWHSVSEHRWLLNLRGAIFYVLKIMRFCFLFHFTCIWCPLLILLVHYLCNPIRHEQEIKTYWWSVLFSVFEYVSPIFHLNVEQIWCLPVLFSLITKFSFAWETFPPTKLSALIKVFNPSPFNHSVLFLSCSHNSSYFQFIRHVYKQHFFSSGI